MKQSTNNAQRLRDQIKATENSETIDFVSKMELIEIYTKQLKQVTRKN